MFKKITIVGILPCLFLLAGCAALTGNQNASNSNQVIVVTATPEPETKVLVVTATPEAVQYVIITATPEPATEVPTATATSAPTATPVPVIKMANTTLQSDHSIYVSWNADGYMPSGFEVVWSTTNSSPSFPGDSSTYISDVNARTATIQTESGKTYYIRVCRYINGACDLYSDVVSVSSGNYATQYQNPAYNQPYSHPYYQQQTRPYCGGYNNATATVVNPYIAISSVRYIGYERAAIRWQASGSFPNGFLILYSTASSAPTYGDYSAYSISSPNTRYYEVSGVKDTTYYYRICRFNGTSCDLYSNVYSYTFK
jgi:hypothetical protein